MGWYFIILKNKPKNEVLTVLWCNITNIISVYNSNCKKENIFLQS